MSTILERLPPLLQNERNREEFQVTFDTDTDVYQLPKGPVLEVHSVTVGSTTFVEGADYSLATTSEGYYKEIDWSLGGDSPNDGEDFTLDQTFKTIINRYSASHDEEFESFGNKVDDTISVHEIDNASGEDLDRVGAMFGELGKRRSRGDQDYRIYLKSVVQSFSGRGSLQGLKFAIASAIGTDSSNIEIVERFDQLEYDVQIFNVETPFISSAINDLAEIADPSVVEFGEAVIVFDAGGIILDGGDSTVVEESVGLGGDTLTLDGNSQLG